VGLLDDGARRWPEQTGERMRVEIANDACLKVGGYDQSRTRGTDTQREADLNARIREEAIALPSRLI
jgi:hypothetical protein